MTIKTKIYGFSSFNKLYIKLGPRGGGEGWLFHFPHAIWASGISLFSDNEQKFVCVCKYGGHFTYLNKQNVLISLLFFWNQSQQTASGLKHSTILIF